MITDLKSYSVPTHKQVASFVQGGGIAAIVQTAGNAFPMNLATTTLVVKVSTDGGATYPTTKTHTFGNGSGTGGQLHYFMSISEVVADIVADATFMSGLVVYALGNELAIKTAVSGNRALKVDATSTGIGGALLQFQSNQIGNGSITTIVSIVCDAANGQFVIFFT